ncbi:MAG TPA: MerR family transcriptional regulator [Puia sp.]|nr:MerR family transcriptional regulator [Puia sp.]
MSKLTQISLDFGQEPSSESTPPPADPSAPYMAAEGVGVRLKSYKRSSTSAPENGDLFAGDGQATAGIADDGERRGETTVPAGHGQATAGIADDGEQRGETTVPAGTSEHNDEAAPVTAIEEPVAEARVAGATEEAGVQASGTATAAETPATSPAKAAVVADDGRAAVTHLKDTRVARPAKKIPPKKGPSKRGRKSLKQVAAEADLIEIPEDEILFSKQYYTMGEVSEMFRVNQSLLRFWEAEFDILQPRKNKKGDRYFRPADIKNLHLIYHLLRQKKYTIEGAKDFLKKNKRAEERFEVIRRLQEIKAFLLEWKAQL